MCGSRGGGLGVEDWWRDLEGGTYSGWETGTCADSFVTMRTNNIDY